MTPDDVLLSVTTLSFDIAGLELFLPLTTGATVVVAPREVVTDASMLIEELERTKATVLKHAITLAIDGGPSNGGTPVRVFLRSGSNNRGARPDAVCDRETPHSPGG